METRTLVLVMVAMAAPTTTAVADAAPKTSLIARRAADKPVSPRVGLALKVDALGAGGDVAVALGRFNVRVGIRAAEVQRGLALEGLELDGRVTLRSVSAYLDWFPAGGHGFHLSPGVMFYNGNRYSAETAVAPGARFTVGGTELMSSLTDPVTGSATIDFARVAPALVVGWGNIVPRGDSHWSVPFEVGLVYVRSPSADLALRGTACVVETGECRDIARDPLLQARVQAEDDALEERMAPIKILPVVSLGVGYRF